MFFFTFSTIKRTAKEMHKQEIIDAYSNGRDKWRLYEIEKQESDNIKIPTPNQYYQETFGGDGISETVTNCHDLEISDEEIEEAADAFEFTNGIYGFKQGVKWCLKQLKQRK